MNTDIFMIYNSINMPYHTGSKSVSKKSNPKPKKTVSKAISIKKELTKSQMDKLKEMRKSHTKKHVDEMVKLLKQGKSFKVAHDMAVKKVGK